MFILGLAAVLLLVLIASVFTVVVLMYSEAYLDLYIFIYKHRIFNVYLYFRISLRISPFHSIHALQQIAFITPPRRDIVLPAPSYGYHVRRLKFAQRTLFLTDIELQ